MTTYIRDIPDQDHNPSADQPNMKTNTNSIDNLIAVDHISFNNGADSGKHKVVRVWDNIVDPPAESAPPYGQIYMRLASGVAPDVGTGRQLFYEQPNGVVQQVTVIPTLATSGYTLLPGAVYMQWGFVNPASHRVNTAVNFPIIFPTAFFSMTISTVRADGSNNADTVSIVSTSTASFTYYNTSSTNLTGFYWMAVGN